MEKYSYSYLLPERGNVSGDGNQGTCTDLQLFNISVNNLDARPENALLERVNDKQWGTVITTEVWITNPN